MDDLEFILHSVRMEGFLTCKFLAPAKLVIPRLSEFTLVRGLFCASFVEFARTNIYVINVIMRKDLKVILEHT